MMALKNEHKVRIYTPQILDGAPTSTDRSFSQLQEMVKDRGIGWAEVHGVTESRTGLTD